MRKVNLSRCYGKIVNQAKWINSINRREENLSSDQVTVLLQELHHNMGSGAVTHHYDIVKVQLQTTVQPTVMQLLLHVLHHPLVHVQQPLCLVVVSRVAQQGPGLDDDDSMAHNTI